MTMQVSGGTVFMAIAIWCLIMYIRDSGLLSSATAAKQTAKSKAVDADSSSNNNNNNNNNNNAREEGYSISNKNTASSSTSSSTSSSSSSSSAAATSYENVDSDGMIDEKQNNFQQHAYLENLRKNRHLRILEAPDIIHSPEKRVNILFCTS